MLANLKPMRVCRRYPLWRCLGRVETLISEDTTAAKTRVFAKVLIRGGMPVSGWSMLLKCCEKRDSETFTIYSEQRKISKHFAHRWQRNWQVLLESL